MKTILKQATILYVEDEEKLREHFNSILEFVMKKVYCAKDGKEAIEIFKNHKDSIDLVVTDIEMQNLNGIELLKEIRKLNEDIPFVITSAFFEAGYLHDSIKYNASAYFTKPIDTEKFFKKLTSLYEKDFNTKELIYKEKELRDYLEILNKVAIISKTDLKGIITYANDIFCKIAKYEKHELIGQPHNIIRHPDMPKSAFKEMWNTIQAGKMWNGKVKNMAKDGSAYYVKASVFPIYNNEKITGYIAIRFLTTEEETEKREFKKKVITNLAQGRIKESELERMNSSYKQEIQELSDKLNKVENKLLQANKLILTQKEQVKFFENEVVQNENKRINLLETKREELEKHINLNKKLKIDKDALSHSNKEMKTNVFKLEKDNDFYKETLLKKNKRIDELLDVINNT